MRIGFGYDIHRLSENRKLILGGIHIEHPLGLLGHSDGDVLIHSIIDSLLGAFALNDIGTHFPDTNEKYRDISSLILLKETMKIIPGKVMNIDATIVAEKPKMAPYISSMRKNIAKNIGIDISNISIKAKTNEGLGSIGKNEAIACYCISLCEEVNK
ncbi:2-C-methyl-D-erythritol 2,4-cyclodiphosphate synthase [candidate division WOR-3 bacterium]|nr:2-C-methyl-D-erythritol 2,4-cyclodiphosphate synthase [candidate division WOR-3 bacterium]